MANPTVEVYCKGMFYHQPFMYFDPTIIRLKDVDLRRLDLSQFKKLIHKELDVYPNTLYCCPYKAPNLIDGIHGLRSECDYSDFVESAYESMIVKIYIDDHNEPIFEWIQMEQPEEGTESYVYEEDVDSELSDNEVPDLEPDDEEVMIRARNRVSYDPFLKKLWTTKKEEPSQPPKPIWPVHNTSADWDKMSPELGMKFASISDLKDCLSNYAVHYGHALYYEKNDKDMVLVKCCKEKDPPCTFRLWATWMKNEKTLQIKSLNPEHNCKRAFKLGAMVTYKWIAKQFMHEILTRERMSLREMKAELSHKFNINVTIVRNARKHALEQIQGTLEEHYSKLFRYASEIKRANPGSNVQVVVEPMSETTVLFDRFYVCFKGIADGWIEGCRRIIGLDGCFLKGVCRGQLLSAVGRDANNQLFPIAWAVVNTESKDTWSWFFEELMADIHEGHGAGLTFMSDGHKGIAEAVKEVCFEADHRLCARHISDRITKLNLSRHVVLKDGSGSSSKPCNID